MTRRATIALLAPILTLTACAGQAPGERAVAAVASECDDSDLAGYLVRDGSRLRIVIMDDPDDIPPAERDALLGMYTCIVAATGYGQAPDDLRDGDTWGRWTYTEDSDGSVTWTAAD
jgi:hypothetical protein